MFGFKFVASISIVLARMKGITETDTILSFLVSVKSSTTEVVIPVLV